MELTKRQKELLAKHSIHHTKKHIDMMITLIKKKVNFNDAHIETMKKLGA